MIELIEILSIALLRQNNTCDFSAPRVLRQNIGINKGETVTVTKTCDQCHKTLDDQIEHWTIHTADAGASDTPVYRCGGCVREGRVNEYLNKGTIATRLWLDATSCEFHRDTGFSRLRDEVREFYTKHWRTLRNVAREMALIERFALRFEIKHWFGSIQAYYRGTDKRGHSAVLQDNKLSLLLWGCAGRVLLTLQGAKVQGEEEVQGQGEREPNYGGASITLIFDETSATPRGGIQSICATAGEASDLLLDAIDSFDVSLLVPDGKVSVG